MTPVREPELRDLAFSLQVRPGIAPMADVQKMFNVRA
jgi:hypothetical protein